MTGGSCTKAMIRMGCPHNPAAHRAAGGYLGGIGAIFSALREPVLTKRISDTRPSKQTYFSNVILPVALSCRVLTR